MSYLALESSKTFYIYSCVGGGKVESIIHYYHKMGSSLLRNFLQCIGSFENFLSSTSHFLLLCFQYFVFSFICRYHNTIMENWEHMSSLNWTQNGNIFGVFWKICLGARGQEWSIQSLNSFTLFEKSVMWFVFLISVKRNNIIMIFHFSACHTIHSFLFIRELRQIFWKGMNLVQSLNTTLNYYSKCKIWTSKLNVDVEGQEKLWCCE